MLDLIIISYKLTTNVSSYLQKCIQHSDWLTILRVTTAVYSGKKRGIQTCLILEHLLLFLQCVNFNLIVSSPDLYTFSCQHLAGQIQHSLWSV